MEIDYKALLVKYISHVCDCEGTNFINRRPYKFVKEVFTEKEWEILNNLCENG